jgi:hypothetical protein
MLPNAVHGDNASSRSSTVRRRRRVSILAALALIGPVESSTNHSNKHQWGPRKTSLEIARQGIPSTVHDQVPCENPRNKARRRKTRGRAPSPFVRVPLGLLPAKMLLISKDWLPGRPAVVKRLARGPRLLLGHQHGPPAWPCFNEVGQLYEASTMSSSEVETGKTNLSCRL